jgi:hypothetical protein
MKHKQKELKGDENNENNKTRSPTHRKKENS